MAEGTPFITQVEPSPLLGYDPSLPDSEQPAAIPRGFLDAMEVRREVFVKEQGVPAENEFDDDDPRSCHWVVYASVNQTTAPEVRDRETGDVVQRRESLTRSLPIGTIRLVPFPHPPHPTPGGAYADGKLVAAAGAEGGSIATVGAPAGAENGHEIGADRATGLHDGKEPYVKLGRLAVRKEFRRHKLGRLLVNAALGWMASNPDYFNPSVASLGFEQLGIDKASDIPKWNGLVCCHAQEAVVGAWEKLGFTVDKAMGRWWEEGIAHVGMFQRLEVKHAS